jgi:UDP-N-acetylmuramoylalanine--D-glutamate ligase
LRGKGISVRLADAETLPEGTDLVVTSPGWKPGSPLFLAAAEAGVDVVGDVEIAWRLRGPDAAPWLAITGTNGKTTTTQMLASILAAAGLRTAAVGNIGTPIVDVVQEGDDALRRTRRRAVQLPAPLGALAARPLRRRPEPRPGPPRLARLHGGVRRRQGPRIYEGNRVACVYNVADKATEDLVRGADVEEGCRAVGFTLGTPGPSQLGVVDGILVDRAFVEDRHKQAQELAEVADVNPPAPHNIANALAAAALARAFGVPAAAVRDGLRAFRPDAHRIQHVADVDGVAYIDDSKATNTHAAEASLAAYESIVWIAGGLAKGATFDELVAKSAKRLRGVVLFGADRALIREALARHAPEVPVVDLDRTDTGAMLAAVREAHGSPEPGDTVLWLRPVPPWTCSPTTTSAATLFAEAVRELGAASA